MNDLITTPASFLSDISKRIYNLEQRITSPGSIPGGDGVFPDITIDDGVHTPVVLNTLPVAAPGGLAATGGTFFDQGFADLSWTAVTGAAAYQVEVARKISGVYQLAQIFPSIANAIRSAPLDQGATYGFRVYSVNRLGTPSAAPSGWFDFTVPVDATIPGVPTGLAVSAGFQSLLTTWNDVADVDVNFGAGLYQIQVSTNAGFTGIVYDKRVGGSIAPVTGLVPNTQYWVRVASIDSSGNASAFSSSVTATTVRAVTADYTPLSVDTAAIGNLAVGTAKIADLAVTNAKVNDLNVGKLTSGSITTAAFTLSGSGVLQIGSNPAVSGGILQNSQGISLYNASGVRTVFLDATTGAATFTGTVSGSTVTGTSISGGTITGTTITGAVIQTATSGARIQMDNTGFGTGEGASHRLRFFTNKTGGDFAGGYIETSYNVMGSLGILHFKPPMPLSTSIVPDISMESGTGSNPRVYIASGTGGSVFIGAYVTLQSGLKNITVDSTLGFTASTDMPRSLLYGAGGSYLDLSTDGYVYIHSSGTDVFFPTPSRISATINQVGQWYNGVAFQSRSGDYAASMSFWAIPYNAGIIQYRGDTNNFDLRNSNNSGYLGIYGSFFTVASSGRFKKEISPITTGSILDQIQLLEPSRYRLKDGVPPEPAPLPFVPVKSFDEKYNKGARKRMLGESLGLIAENVYKVFPEAVHLDEDEKPLGVDPYAIVAVLVQGVRELTVKVKHLERALGIV